MTESRHAVQIGIIRSSDAAAQRLGLPFRFRAEGVS